jgi:hypothetical protein
LIAKLGMYPNSSFLFTWKNSSIPVKSFTKSATAPLQKD